MSANPAFGLNALGGSLALTTKKGLDFKNTEFVDTLNKYGSLTQELQNNSNFYLNLIYSFTNLLRNNFLIDTLHFHTFQVASTHH